MRVLNQEEVQAVSGSGYTSAAITSIYENFAKYPVKAIFLGPFILIAAVGIDLFFPGAVL